MARELHVAVTGNDWAKGCADNVTVGSLTGLKPGHNKIRVR